jgi:hypothetical protein
VFDKGNWDYDHRLPYTKSPKMRGYGFLGDRKHFCSSRWSKDRKQHNSRAMRDNYLRSDKKHTRQLLNDDLRRQLNEYDA